MISSSFSVKEISTPLEKLRLPTNILGDELDPTLDKEGHNLLRDLWER